ncbi:DUF6441 family protein [Azospirillum picis]|uniref:Uncharacterized protein n=1 Tax=Azospirillum picis TaxID=488438 RepID=A0ABU0MUG0_9PROT|nr:DUF6441 family protein [Azospirillum picis]MBP2303328.1 hypothetical protein [Azospirillum picis]MDQ0537132.1 hypothetical protein [Azospirillum picis]
MGDGDFREWVGEVKQDLAAGVTASVHELVDGAAERLRAQLSAAFPGTNAASMVGSVYYPRVGISLDPAGMVIARGARAHAAISAWAEGVTIRSADGFWLAIPTPSVPRSGRGGHRRMTPGEVEAMYGRALRLVPSRDGRSGLLYMDFLTPALSGKGYRSATSRRVAAGRAAQGVLMFVLTPQARLPRRLDLDAAFAGGDDQFSEG